MLTAPRPNVRRLHPLDRCQRIRPVEQFEQEMAEEPDLPPVTPFRYWFLLAFGTAFLSGLLLAILIVQVWP